MKVLSALNTENVSNRIDKDIKANYFNPDHRLWWQVICELAMVSSPNFYPQVKRSISFL